jgi:hypothetical protein
MSAIDTTFDQIYAELGNIREEIRGLRHDFREEMRAFRGELGEEMRAFREEVREDIQAVRADVAASQRQMAQIGWAMVGTLTVAMVAVVVALA